MRLGFHMPLSGGIKKQLQRAHDLGMETVQIFSGNPTAWKPGKIDEKTKTKFLEEQERLDIKPLVFHTPYLINLASGKEEIREKSIKLLEAALNKASIYEAPYVVTHVGSHVDIEKEQGIENICECLERSFSKWPDGVMLLLENTAGAGKTLGGSFSDLKCILTNVSDRKRLGCCFDTAHAWGAGYNISDKQGVKNTLDEIDKEIGLNSIKVCHANDTSVTIGSNKDRHQHIGEGYIGIKGFSELLTNEKFNPEAVIMETPKIGSEHDKKNLDNLKEALGK
ncbi:deoxyribonuclease IV [Natranaerobius trueperi]|uniref:Probable endonuclease 4 n=1 Tax=Natranaerobius trueperi TaxID=759412 RepID=A0A226C019_9FIRM|nr:deoxyribonuclease IV [Natranaerobius trueperi]OWZ84521.1 endonuclease [Natranaerobius trueperi]